METLFEDSRDAAIELITYMEEEGNDYHDNLEIEPRLKFTLDVSVLTSKVGFCIAYTLAYKAYYNKQITLKRLLKYSKPDDLEDYASDYPGLNSHKERIEGIYNSIMKLIKVVK